MWPKQKALPNSDIAVFLLKTPYARLGHMQEFLATVLFLICDRETKNLQ